MYKFIFLIESYKRLPSFERWQIGLSFASIAISFLACAAVIFFGWTQNKINQNLLDLNYEPSVVITYIKPGADTTLLEPNIGHWKISNYGKNKIFIRNVILSVNMPGLPNQEPFFLNGSGKYIAPGTSEYFFAPIPDVVIEKYKEQRVTSFGAPLKIDFESADGKYIAHGIFSLSIEKDTAEARIDLISYTRKSP